MKDGSARLFAASTERSNDGSARTKFAPSDDARVNRRDPAVLEIVSLEPQLSATSVEAALLSSTTTTTTTTMARTHLPTSVAPTSVSLSGVIASASHTSIESRDVPGSVAAISNAR